MVGLTAHFLGNQGGSNATLLPVSAKVEFPALIEDLNR